MLLREEEYVRNEQQLCIRYQLLEYICNYIQIDLIEMFKMFNSTDKTPLYSHHPMNRD